MDYEHCPHCKSALCYIDRTYENCVWCSGPLPTELQLDLDLEPLQVQDETV
jgi:hypothetical protein